MTYVGKVVIMMAITTFNMKGCAYYEGNERQILTDEICHYFPCRQTDKDPNDCAQSTGPD